ncbi:hypothetical protein TNCV_2050961 [Trichonephila clavipes]|nr:hypothetical protein TNCV_2050961 [Trichonephila clavipes]
MQRVPNSPTWSPMTPSSPKLPNWPPTWSPKIMSTGLYRQVIELPLQRKPQAFQSVLRRKRTHVTFGGNWEAFFASIKIDAPQVTSRISPGVDLSRCKDHVLFRIHMTAGSRLRKVVRKFVPEKAYMRSEQL